MKISSSLLLVEEWRDVWPLKAEFIFVALAYLFATTNFLNFPYLMLRNGGLAFVAAYGAALLVVVLPIVVLELAVGQLTGRGPTQAFYNICPVFKGIGVSQVVFSLFVMAYMTRYLAWLLLYLFHLFWSVVDDRPGLPWLQCTSFPELQLLGGECREPSSLITASLFSSVDSINSTATVAALEEDGTSHISKRLATLHDDSALSQFMRSLEQPSASIAEIGDFQLYFVAAQGAVWILVFLAICFGVRWLGKVVAFTFLLPLALLLTLCGRSLFLAGAIDMFEKVYASTDWEKLGDYMVWKTAVEQAVLASGIGFGAFVTMGSYNKRANNLVRDSFFLLAGHAMISALQVATVLSLVGYVSFKTSLAPVDLVEKGENQMWQMLVYPAFIPHTKIFTAILLLMCIFVLLNVFPRWKMAWARGEFWAEDHFRCYVMEYQLVLFRASKWLPRLFLALFVSLLGAASSTYFATQAGKYAYELTSGYLKYVTLCGILTMELFAVAWFYCAHTLAKDVKSMLQDAMCCSWCLGYFILYVTYLLPAVPIGIIVINAWTYSYDVYSEGIRNWEWSEWVGATIALLPLLPIPLFAMAAIYHSCHFAYDEHTSRGQRFRYAFRSPMQYEGMKSPKALGGLSEHLSPKYNAAAPGYVLLPQAPLAEPEFIDANNPNNAATTMSTTATGSGL